MKKVAVIGAGPAGISAAYELSRRNFQIDLHEKSEMIGGLARTISYSDSRFDIGPHRFFTYNKEVEKLYVETLMSDAVEVKRLTRILFNNKLFNYPLSPFGTLLKIGFLGSIKILFSYSISLFERIILRKEPKNFEEWVELNFGKELHYKFFKSYTEKVWGIDCKEISADWAAQRIKNLSFIGVILNPIIKFFKKKNVKTLVDKFWYPRLGAGQFYEKLIKKIDKDKFNLICKSELCEIKHDGSKITKISLENNGTKKDLEYDYFFVSSPFTKIAENLNPKPPIEVLKSCNRLKYRHHIGVKLLITGKIFLDNWIYIHDPNVKMARVSNYLNFSKDMSSDPNQNPLTIEYFCFESDDVWKMDEKELMTLAEEELRKTKLIGEKNKVLSGFTVRSLNAYPVIKKGYQRDVDNVNNFLSKFENLFPIGRSGMFKYNNQDHAIATGLYAARNLENLNNKIDIWKINSEGIYQEGETEEKI